MSIILNGVEYTAADFEGYGYLGRFPEAIFANMLAEIALQLAVLSPYAAGIPQEAANQAEEDAFFAAGYRFVIRTDLIAGYTTTTGGPTTTTTTAAPTTTTTGAGTTTTTTAAPVDLTWDPARKSTAAVLTNSNNTAQGGTTSWHSVLATASANSGLRYCEFDFATNGASSAGVGISVAISGAPLESFFAATAAGVMWELSTNAIYYNGSSTGSGPATVTGNNRLTMAWNASNGKVWFGLNATPNIAGAHHGTLTGPVFPATAFNTNNANITVTLKDQPADWLYSAPTDYTSW